MAGGGTISGIVLLGAALAAKGCLALGFEVTLSACVTVGKVTRERHESERLYNKVERAKTEQFLSEKENPGSSF
jgi:hypothetical protein